MLTIGNTPLFRLERLPEPGSADIFVKFEGANPTGSMKDRMALSMVQGAITRGELAPGGRLIEWTGGSTGSSLAMVCATLGVRAHFVSSDAFSEEKLQTMRAFGATLDVLPCEGGRITAAAKTGPARQPRPASSQPASSRPFSRYGFSLLTRARLAFFARFWVSYMLMTLISTLRFWLRPSEVKFVLIGWVLPNPEELSLSFFTPFFTNQLTTACDLRIDSCLLYSVLPTLSVCPMISTCMVGYLFKNAQSWSSWIKALGMKSVRSCSK